MTPSHKLETLEGKQPWLAQENTGNINIGRSVIGQVVKHNVVTMWHRKGLNGKQRVQWGFLSNR